MEPFKNNPDAPPVLLLTNNIDEFCFQNIRKYKDKVFASAETAFEEIQKEIGAKDIAVEKDSEGHTKLPEEDVTAFCLWIKNEFPKIISSVTISKRIKNTPAIVTGQMSSSMRIMMQMMD